MCIDALNGMADTIVELERKLAEREWIPCSERLPDVDVEVLATVDWADVRIAWLKKSGTWETDEYILENDEILAWMPLPDPYKGGDEYEKCVEQMEHDIMYEPTYNQDDGSM